MFDLIFEVLDYSEVKRIFSFYGMERKKESDYLARKRQEIIEADKAKGKDAKLLVNNPTRPVSLRKNSVLS